MCHEIYRRVLWIYNFLSLVIVSSSLLQNMCHSFLWKYLHPFSFLATLEKMTIPHSLLEVKIPITYPNLNSLGHLRYHCHHGSSSGSVTCANYPSSYGDCTYWKYHIVIACRLSIVHLTPYAFHFYVIVLYRPNLSPPLLVINLALKIITIP